MKNSVLLLAALALGTSFSCNRDDDDDAMIVPATPVAEPADALVGNYTTYDTVSFNIFGADTSFVSSDAGAISKVSASRVQLIGIIDNICADTAKAEVSESTLVVYNNACYSGLTISRSGTTVRYSVVDNSSGFEVRFTGRAEKQP